MTDTDGDGYLSEQEVDRFFLYFTVFFYRMACNVLKLDLEHSLPGPERTALETLSQDCASRLAHAEEKSAEAARDGLFETMDANADHMIPSFFSSL